MKQAFISKDFKPSSLALIDRANEIIENYTARGFRLTLRQLYYQFVARDLLPNKQTEYKRLGKIINDGRLAGMIDWHAIEDRTRFLRTHASWETPEDIIDGAAAAYREDIWQPQEYRPEVWIEKDALVGVIEGVCNEWRVPYFACRGYASQSELYSAGRRLRRLVRDGKRPVIFHLGDHDPSGLDMTRDNQDRLNMFSEFEGVEVRRLALNMDQIDEHNPPPNPAKETDARFGPYIRQYGESSWELDALDPDVIHNLIDGAVQALIDFDAWGEAKTQEEENQELLKRISLRWDDVADFLEETDGE